MQYGIPNCLSHISNPFETVPSEPVTIEMTWIERQFQIHLISYLRSQYLSVFSISLLKYRYYFGVEWAAGNINVIKLSL